MARHFSRDQRENPAPPRRTGRPQIQFHHSRHGRSDPPAQTGFEGREHRRQALAGARAGASDRRLEEPRPDARASAGGRGARLRRRQGRGALRALSGAPENPQRRRFRRSAARGAAAVSRQPGRARRLSAALQIYSGRRISGHQHRAISVAAADRARAAQRLLRRRRRPERLWLARRRGRKHPALRKGFSRRENRAARAQLSLHRPYSRRRLASDRPQ